ncbi:hypothetical protein [Providencia phage PSTCR6]|nr:hypothetical protein [Providencia phage PSTCR6]
MKSIAKIMFGSHLYGTSTPESDIDYKEIYIPDPKSIITCSVKEHFNMNTNNTSQKNSVDDIDHELYSLKYFIDLASKGETVALDVLHAPKEMVVHSDVPSVWDYLQANRARFYTTNMRAYLGYVRKQAAKYGVKGSRLAALRQVVEVLRQQEDIKISSSSTGYTWPKTIRRKVSDIKDLLPIIGDMCFFTNLTDHNGHEQLFYEVLGRKFQMTITIEEMKKSLYKLWDEYGERARKAEENEGIDWKALSHAYRAGVQLLEIYETGDLVMPLKMAPEILDIKQGKIGFKIVQQNLEAIIDEVEAKADIARKNGMPSKVDMDFWNKFIFDVYSTEVKNYLK